MSRSSHKAKQEKKLFFEPPFFPFRLFSSFFRFTVLFFPTFLSSFSPPFPPSHSEDDNKITQSISQLIRATRRTSVGPQEAGTVPKRSSTAAALCRAHEATLRLFICRRSRVTTHTGHSATAVTLCSRTYHKASRRTCHQACCGDCCKASGKTHNEACCEISCCGWHTASKDTVPIEQTSISTKGVSSSNNCTVTVTDPAERTLCLHHSHTSTCIIRLSLSADGDTQKVVEQVGTGANGVIVRAIDTNTGGIVAIKSIKTVCQGTLTWKHLLCNKFHKHPTTTLPSILQ